MGFLFSSKKKHAPPEITGLQLQTAVNVLPIPIVYGSPRIPINIIYANGFNAKAIKSSGGKGLLTGGKGQTTGYNYYCSFIGALCEGEVGPIIGIFDDQMVYDLSRVPSGKNYTLYNGTATQTPNIYIVNNWPNDAFAYKDTAYIWCYNYLLDSSATVPQLNILTFGPHAGSMPLFPFTSPDGAYTNVSLDANPAECIYDFLTNERYGVGFPANYIDTTTLLQQPNGIVAGVGSPDVDCYCQAVGLGWSVVLNTAEAASSILDRWCKNLVVAPVWTGTILKFFPYWDTYADGNPGYYSGQPVPRKYYNPNIVVLFDLNDDDYIQAAQAEDPLTVSRVDVADVKNVARIDFKDRNNEFNANVAEAKNEVLVQMYGPRVDKMGQADEFTLNVYAQTSVNAQLQRDIAIRNTFTFRLGWQWCILDPMDIVTVTDANLGLNKQPVRITSIEEDEKGILTIVAEEFPMGSATATLHPSESNSPPMNFQTNITPQQVNPPAIFEPTPAALAAESVSSPQVVVGLCAGPSGAFDPNWGGANILASIDNVTYEQVAVINGPSRMGTLGAVLPAFSGANPDSTNTLNVDLTESDSVLETVTSDQAAAALSACVVIDPNGDFEILSYTTATLTSPSVFNLTGLYRGLYGTIACSHPIGAIFARLDAFVSQIPLPPQWINQQLYFKFQSFNIYFTDELDSSTLTAYTYTPVGNGIDLSTNTINLQLLSGNPVDLDTGSASLDLSVGSSGGCAPITFAVDLN